VLGVIDRGAYGWVEYIAPLPCDAPDQIERFYRRHGALLALFHILLATDMHRENMIAHGEQANIRVRRFGNRDVPYGTAVPA